MGSTKVSAPQPSPEERRLQAMQLEMIQQQRAESEAMKPYLLESLGLRQVDGKYEEVPWEERLAGMNPQERAQYDLAQSYLTRQQQALAGQIPVSPALEAELESQKSQLSENLSRKLGPDWHASTSGIQAMSEFDKRAGLLREEARRGQISTGEGLIGARMGLLGAQQAQSYGQQSAWNLPQYGAQTSGIAHAYQPYQYQRGLEYDAARQSAANRAGLLSSIGGVVGQGLGLYAGMRTPRGGAGMPDWMAY